MSASCHNHSAHCNDPAFRNSLRKCMAANLFMFLLEMIAGSYAKSLSILADAMDFLSDSVSYALGLYALGKPPRFRSYVALFNALTMAVLGLWIMYQAVLRFYAPAIPHAGVMGGVSILALTANFLSTYWLYKHREGDSLEQSLWMCSRNDMLNNLATLAAAGLVSITATPWPDMAIAAMILTVEMRSAWKVFHQARRELSVK